jgi:L-asparaginase
MNNLTPHFFYEPAQPTGKPYFEITDLADLPQVAIFVCHMDMDLSELEKRLDDDDIKGIVIAGFGSVRVFLLLLWYLL